MEPTHTLSCIEPGCVYSVAEVRRRFRIGQKAWKSLRDAGLPVRRLGHNSFVSSDDLIKALRPDDATKEGAHA